MRMRCLPILGAAAILAISGCSDSPATEPTLTSTTVADSTTTPVEEARAQVLSRLWAKPNALRLLLSSPGLTTANQASLPR